MAGRGVDNEAQKFLGILRDQKLPQALPEEPNITRFQVDWSGKEGECSRSVAPFTPARLITRAKAYLPAHIHCDFFFVRIRKNSKAMWH